MSEFEILTAELADRYEIQGELGQGGMATVYQARDLRHERLVAIKVLRPELGSAIGVDRFLREIRIAAQLSHPHILPLYDSGAAKGVLYYVMPLVEGESLRDRMEREGQLGIEDALQLIREVADALSFAHSRGLVHRDIKPENIMLSGGHALVMDFGIARAVDAAGSERLTETGLAIGTPAYMSPEQWTGTERIDARSDLYSLAAVLYEMLVGEPPFTGRTPHIVMARASMERMPSIHVARPNVPPGIEQTIERALAKVPADRFTTVFQFVEALQAGVSQTAAVPSRPAEPVAGTPPPTPVSAFRRPWRIRAVLMAAAALFLTAAGTAVFLFTRGDGEAYPTRLVVLPFENLGQPSDEYFADGLTEELTGRLASVAGLAVIARTSTMQYRGSTKGVALIGEELDVAYVVEGSVRWEHPSSESGQVRMSARLIKVADGVQVWGADYQMPLEGLFDIQSNIAERVTTALDIALLESARHRIGGTPTQSVSAYDAYLRGISAYNRSWQRTDVEEALRMYERATVLDPAFALAFARLGITRAWAHRLGYDPSEEGLRAALQAADSAIALDPELAEGYVARGLYYYWGRWILDRAVDALARARQFQPSSVPVHLNIGNVRRRQGIWTEAAASYERAAELDPRSQTAWFNLGETYLFTRQYDEAARNLDRASTLAPDLLDNYIARATLAIDRDGDVEMAQQIMRAAEEQIPPEGWRPLWGYWLMGFARIFYPTQGDALSRLRPGQYGLDSAVYYAAKAEVLARSGDANTARALNDSARIMLEASLPTDRAPSADDAWVFGALGVVQAALGHRDEALAAAQRAVELVPTTDDAFDGPDWVINLARVWLILGDRDRALANLELALQDPSRLSANWVRLDPVWAPLRDDPRIERAAAAGLPRTRK